MKTGRLHPQGQHRGGSEIKDTPLGPGRHLLSSVRGGERSSFPKLGLASDNLPWDSRGDANLWSF